MVEPEEEKVAVEPQGFEAENSGGFDAANSRNDATVNSWKC